MTAGVTIPRRILARSMKLFVDGSCDIPQPTYGFSRGFRSIARPYAWFDQCPDFVPPVHGDGTACRQWKEPEMSLSRGRPLAGPYMSESSRCRIGQRSP